MVLVLLGLVARAEADPHDDAVALAVRYAEILTGIDQQSAADDPDDDDPDDTAAAAAEDDDGSGDADDDDDAAADDASVRPEPATGPRADAADGAGADTDSLDADAATATDDTETLDADSRADAGGDQPFAGELAMLDPGDVYAAEPLDPSAAFQTAGGAELYDAWTLHQRPSRFGRLDVDLSYRTYRSDPRVGPAYHSRELWLIATWRR